MVTNLRNIAAFLFSWVLLRSPMMRRLKERAQRGEIILSVYFHDPAKELFEKTIHWFQKNGFQFISVDTLREILIESRPFPKAAVVLSADDGWKNNYENIIEVANRLRVPVTIFATTTPVETGEAYWWSYFQAAQKMGLINESPRVMKQRTDVQRVEFVNELKSKIELSRESLTVEQVKQADKTSFVSIESHTVTHPMLSKCSDHKSKFEIIESKKILEGWLQKPITQFAYPNGDYTEREIRYLHEAGYEIAFSTEADYVYSNKHHDIYQIPRFDVLEEVSFTENICRMTGIWFWRSGKRKPK
jgi:poly-beta-1,6-N-acetyl-D-glucosamine N-deacetylase